MFIDDTPSFFQLIDSSLANILTFDTSGIEFFVPENNPKTLNSLIKRLKAFYKDNPNVDHYKIAYGLSIVRDIVFLDADFKVHHPKLPVEKKSDSPEEDKTISDSSTLKPILSDFFAAHQDFHPDTFLGDVAFDSADIYGFLINDFGFQKALIPYNPRNESTLKKVGFNDYGYPTCPNDTSLAMKCYGSTKEKGRSDRTKWCCPKVHMVKGQWVCEINHFKTNMCIAGKHARNHATTKADVFLAEIANQLTVIVASRMGCPEYIRSLKPLAA